MKPTPYATSLIEKSEAKHAHKSAFRQIAVELRQLEKREIKPVSSLEFTPASPEESAARRELKPIAKRKSPAKAARKDKWISPELRAETASRLVGFVIKRIELPRFGEPFPLSHTDKADATQAGILAVHESGFFRHGFAGIAVIRAIRNAIQGRQCLRLRCKSELISDKIEELADAAGFITEEETVSNRLRKSQVESSREIMRTLRAARDCDTSRKAAASFKSQRGMFLLTLGILTGKTPREISTGAFDTRKSRILDYLAIGAESLRANRKPANLGAEIMQALEIRGLAIA